MKTNIGTDTLTHEAKPHICASWGNYGIDNYKLIVNQGQKQRYEIYYNYFQTLMQKYK